MKSDLHSPPANKRQGGSPHSEESELPLLSNASSKTVSVRFDREDYITLMELAKAENLSIGALVKKRALSDSALPTSDGAVGLRLDAIETHLASFRSDFILAIEALLFAGGKFSPEEAEEWVKNKITSNL